MFGAHEELFDVKHGLDITIEFDGLSVVNFDLLRITCFREIQYKFVCHLSSALFSVRWIW